MRIGELKPGDRFAHNSRLYRVLSDYQSECDHILRPQGLAYNYICVLDVVNGYRVISLAPNLEVEYRS